MDTLFPLNPVFPPGFAYFPDFFSEEEEKEMLALISTMDLHNFKFHGYEAHRKVISFGYDYHFDSKTLTKGQEIPFAFDPLLEKVALHLDIRKKEFAELLVTEYPTGSVINWHRDAFPFELIAGISLLSDCTFQLRPHDKIKQGRSSIVSFPVMRRSLYVMQGSARTGWQHSITPVKSKRYSITLRTLKNTYL